MPNAIHGAERRHQGKMGRAEMLRRQSRHNRGVGMLAKIMEAASYLGPFLRLIPCLFPPEIRVACTDLNGI
jgi:hypothetical protein